MVSDQVVERYEDGSSMASSDIRGSRDGVRSARADSKMLPHTALRISGGWMVVAMSEDSLFSRMCILMMQGMEGER